MRRNCALLLAALLALLVLPVRAAEGAELAVDSRVLTGEEETVTLAVTLTGGTDNCGGGFILWYDSLCLELTELEAGPALDGAVTAANPALGDGVAKLSWASVTPLVGEGVAARATFRVLSREASQVELLNAELLDQSGAALPLRVVNGTVGPEDEPEPSPTPAPETGGEPERPQGESPSGGGSARPDGPDETEEPGGQAPEPWRSPFLDVAPGAWYYDAVAWAAEAGYFQGTAADRFSPEAPMSRAMLAAVLWRMEGSPAAAGDLSAFADREAVPAWAAEPLAWAVEAGVLQGDGARILPQAELTREMLAVMLYRLGGAPAESSVLERFSDAASVSPWAREAAAWAVSAGILTGRGGGLLAPGDGAARAEAAAMLFRLSA